MKQYSNAPFSGNSDPANSINNSKSTSLINNMPTEPPPLCQSEKVVTDDLPPKKSTSESGKTQPCMSKNPKKGQCENLIGRVMKQVIDVSDFGTSPGDTIVFNIVHSPQQEVVVHIITASKEPLPAEITLDSEDLRSALIRDLLNCTDVDLLTNIVVRLVKEGRLSSDNARSTIFLKKFKPFCPQISFTTKLKRRLQRHIDKKLNPTRLHKSTSRKHF